MQLLLKWKLGHPKCERRKIFLKELANPRWSFPISLTLCICLWNRTGNLIQEVISRLLIQFRYNKGLVDKDNLRNGLFTPKLNIFPPYKWRETCDQQQQKVQLFSPHSCPWDQEQGLLSHQPPVYNGQLRLTFQSHTILEYIPITA